ncbi:MAG: hypothetical protein RLZZ449_1079, partial [Actinomycetota bacterium]
MWSESFSIDGDEALQHSGKRRTYLDLADVSEHRADVDESLVREVGSTCKDTCARRDHQSFDGKEMLSLVAS